MSDGLLVVRDLNVGFSTSVGKVDAVNGVSYALGRGETLCMVGESGSGKSVHALAIMGLLSPRVARVSGDVRFKGRSLLDMAPRELRGLLGNELAMVFQDSTSTLNPVYRVGRQLAEPLRVHKGLGRAAAWGRAVELFRLVGISEPELRARDYPHQLSGGMRQRVMLAMALACEPDLLIADEPTASLDCVARMRVIRLIVEAQRRTGCAVLLITHDLSMAAEMADHVLVLYAGRIMEIGPMQDIFGGPMHPYTQGLVDSLPHAHTALRATLGSIAGQPPSFAENSDGCPFEPRCRHASPRCVSEFPSLRPVGAAHLAACHFAGEAGFPCAEGDETVEASA